MNTRICHHRRPLDRSRCRRGTTIFETFVALTLISTTLAVAAPLLVRHNRLLISARHYRLACDELANQIELLSALPAEEVAEAIARIEVSPFTAERLHDAALTATLADDEVGQRLTLGITWDEPGRSTAPLTLVAWIHDATNLAFAPGAPRFSEPRSAASDDDSDESESFPEEDAS
jgi:hypothetical protein